MEEFNFNGDWKFDLQLTELAKLNSDKWFTSDRSAAHKHKLSNGLVPVRIFDEQNYNPDPNVPQISCIKYLENNGARILASLLNIFKNEINPKYVEACGENDWIPQLSTPEDLGLLIGITEVNILYENKDNYSYWQLNCEYKGDVEHGLAIILHKDRLIGYSGIGDMSYECVYSDLGVEKSKIYERMFANRNFGINMIHKPLEKYNKFKPWQLNVTEDYFSELLRKPDNEKLIEDIQNHQWDINLRFTSLGKNLVDLAAYYNNADMIDYLILLGADFSKSMLHCTDYYIKKEAIKCLVDHGANVDVFGYWKVTPLYNAILNYLSELSRSNEYKNTDLNRYEKSLNELDERKDKLLFYVEMGADPYCLNDAGDDYKTMIRNRWAEHYIIKHDMINHIESLLNVK